MDMNRKRHLLVTNDDGIDSYYMECLVASLMTTFEVTIAAPASEQSWIGRAVSRRTKVSVDKVEDYPLSCPAWAIGGTPTDCVNIALGHLLERKPDAVVSGINLGFNATQNLIFCSGTVAGAAEGAFWGLPAIAFSKVIPKDAFETISKAKGKGDPQHNRDLSEAAKYAVALTEACIAQHDHRPKVVNINFPAQTSPETLVHETTPAPLFLGSLFQKQSCGHYTFVYGEGEELTHDSSLPSDLEILRAGHISRTLLDFSALGMRQTE